MTIRENIENTEEKNLSQYASLSKNSKGRDVEEKECKYRTCYTRDRDRIIHSKSFRRLKRKTQVFLVPEGDHYRTRLTHTLEVSQIARTLAKTLRLNEDLTEAIALGHDLGHTPFGHMGERVLNELMPSGFEHNKQSVRIVEKIERNGEGLNLTWETRDGILNHGTECKPGTLEGKCVQLADKIAYINHDTDDAINAKILKETDIPKEYRDVLGSSVRKRIDTLIVSTIEASKDKNDILMDKKIYKVMYELRGWLFANLYNSERVRAEEGKAVHMIENLYEYYRKNIDKLPQEYKILLDKGEKKDIVVGDYISGMTDEYAIYKFESLFIPKGWSYENI